MTAKPKPTSSPLPPYIEYLFDQQKNIKYDKIYDSFLFGDKGPIRKDFVGTFLVPLVSYKITDIQKESNRTTIKVNEVLYEYEAFEKELLGFDIEKLYSTNFLTLPKEKQNEAIKQLSDKIISEFDRNYVNARKVNTHEDEITYVVEKVNNE